MKRMELTALMALAILGVAVLPIAMAQAAKPQAVSLTFTMHFTSATTATGTWTSTSDLTVLNAKSGTVVQTTKITGKGNKTGQIVHGRKVVTASDGTFVIQFNGGLKPTGATTSEVNGRFILKKGTGAYKGLHGNGKIHATLDSSTGAITAAYTGKAHVQNKT